jgi:hypothetical protein
MKFRHQNVVWYYRRDVRYRCPNVGCEEFIRDNVSGKNYITWNEESVLWLWMFNAMLLRVVKTKSNVLSRRLRYDQLLSMNIQSQRKIFHVSRIRVNRRIIQLLFRILSLLSKSFLYDNNKKCWESEEEKNKNIFNAKRIRCNGPKP